MDISDQIIYDKEHLWHPYTSMINPLKVYHVESTEGVYINLSDGRRLIDGMSSWWCAVHGYNNPELVNAAKEQIDIMPHIMFGGLTHSPAVKLAEALIKILPKGLNKIFYSDSGSVSIEVALKMAIQYQYSKGNINKNGIATIKGGYHGDTWHAMSVCDPVGGMHTLYNGRLTSQFFADSPSIGFYDEWNDSDFDSMRSLLTNNSDKIAAVVLEPIVQGAGGMRFYHPNYLKMLRMECDKHDILLIFDEIATGFGRSGKMFACEWANVTPDIMTIGKALTGGFMSFAATIASDDVANTISSSFPHSFMHGPTFMANPLACSVALKSVTMIINNNPLSRIKEIEIILKEKLNKAIQFNNVKDVRVLGTIGVIEMKENVDQEKIQAQFVENGVWIRPFGRLVYIMPPYIIKNDELELLCNAMVNIVKNQ